MMRRLSRARSFAIIAAVGGNGIDCDAVGFAGAAKYREVAERLRDDILSGKYAPGSAFPSVKMICRRFGVSHLTAVKSIEVLKQLGLVRSRNGVGSFVSRRMMTIGLLVPMMKQVEIYPPICQEISRLCQGKGIAVDFADISYTSAECLPGDVVATSRRMAASDVSGVIYHPVNFVTGAVKANREALGVFRKSGIPVVILDTDVFPALGDNRLDFVGVDNFEIGRFVGQHVIERGANEIAFVCWADMNENVRRRIDGVVSAISQKRGARLLGKHIFKKDEGMLERRWRRRLPDAVVCASDFVAANVLKLLSKIGRRCPQEVLVTGVDDVSLASLTSPSLTTVHQPCISLARTAFETLLWRIDNPEAEKRRVTVAADLVVRESTTR